MADSPDNLHRDFQTAFNRHDVDAVMKLYEEDAVLVRGGGHTRGKDAIRQAYLEVFAKHPAIELTTLAVHQAGSLAMLFGRWTLRETDANGGTIQRDGKNTEVVRLQPDGRWLFVIDNPYAA
jgi:uncharacterized protein (TIGR02246 family)